MKFLVFLVPKYYNQSKFCILPEVTSGHFQILMGLFHLEIFLSNLLYNMQWPICNMS